MSQKIRGVRDVDCVKLEQDFSGPFVIRALLLSSKVVEDLFK